MLFALEVSSVRSGMLACGDGVSGYVGMGLLAGGNGRRVLRGCL